MLDILLESLPASEAAKLAARITGAPSNALYTLAASGAQAAQVESRAMDRLTLITRPDDWHLHLRDGAGDGRGAARQRAALRARHRHAEPEAAGDHHRSRRSPTASASSPRCPRARDFEPLMTLYLTDDTPPEEIARAKRSGHRARGEALPGRRHHQFATPA